MNRLYSLTWWLGLAVGCAGAQTPKPPEEAPKAVEVAGRKVGEEVTPDLSIMVKIPAGEFYMGCNPRVDNECEEDEKPGHLVFLDEYWIDRTEVTIGQYKACVEAGWCKEPETWKDCNWGKSERDRAPVNCVDWELARAFCEWAGKRLPTEAEWEKAARGTDGRKYSWGGLDINCLHAVMSKGGKGCGISTTWPVCSKSAGDSPYGLCDMLGNVGEWVADWHLKDYYAVSPSQNPKGPDGGIEKVVRGGSWYESPVLLRASRRLAVAPDGGAVDEGIRCAWSPGTATRGTAQGTSTPQPSSQR